jgi:hypothetical protein
VLALCADRTLDGVATVRISTAAPTVVAEVEVRDLNGDLFSDTDGPRDPVTSAVRTAKTSFAVRAAPSPPATGDASDVAAPVSTPATPPLLWFDDRGERAVLGDITLANGEEYRVMGRADLQARYAERAARKTTLKVLGGVALGLGTLVAMPAVLTKLVCTNDCTKANALLVVSGVLGWGGIAALIVGGVTDANPVDYHERLDLARSYNRSRVQGHVSLAPTPAGDGGLVTVGGIF